MIRYLSICSGIEAASVAFGPLGWRPVAFSEIDPFCCALLAHHYPDVPNLGDMTKFDQWEILNHAGAVDLVCGGTPCQGFSVAGLRKGLDDDRSNLALDFLSIVGRARPRWVLWENVPGVLSTNGGRDFGAFLGGLEQLGYGWAYRTLDAQYVRVDGYLRAVPQRRRRVFVVGHIGDWRPAAAVLLERESLRWHPPPRREAWKGTATPVIKGAAIGRSDAAGPQRGDFSTDGACYTLDCVDRHAIAAPVSFKPSHFTRGKDGAPSNIAAPLSADADRGDQEQVVAFNWQSGGDCRLGAKRDRTDALHACQTPAVMASTAVRRLTPRECERLQGFPDDYTLIPYHSKPAADGPRYRALGNSWAVNCARWIARRIEMVELCRAPERTQKHATAREALATDANRH